MTISNISNSQSMAVSSLQGAGMRAGNVGAKRPPPPPGGMAGSKAPAGAGGALPAAVSQTLSKLGILDTDSSLNSMSKSGSGTQSDSAKVQAIGSFMLDLMGALHAQREPGGTAPSQTEGGDDTQVLEQSFLSLLSALGASDSQVSLKDFLTALSETGVSSSGNVIDTVA